MKRLAGLGGAAAGGAGLDGPAPVVVWDPVVRLFHGAVIAGCVLNLFVLDTGKRPHEIVGYAIAAALALRVVWGFVGTRHARFADFLPTPRRLVPYLRARLGGRAPRRLGHNPAGAVMMLLLMALLAGLALTGWMQTLDAFWGVAWVQDTHEVLSDALLWCVALHASAAIVESLRHRENLVLAMITGRKRALDAGPAGRG